MKYYSNFNFGLVVVFLSVAELCLCTPSQGQQVRTYEFLANEFNYFADCGECSDVLGTRAHVTGNFQVILDFETATGILHSLEAALVEVEQLVRKSNGDTEWIPSPDSSLFGNILVGDNYKPPLVGVLTSEDPRLVLNSDGLIASPDSMFLAITSSFEIRMQGNFAELDFMVPIIEVIPRIVEAKAVLVSVVPEPNGVVLILAAGTNILLLRRL